MRRLVDYVPAGIFTVLSLTFIFFLTAQSGSAQECPFSLTKVAPGGEDVVFLFFVQGPIESGFFPLNGGETAPGALDEGVTVSLTEEETPGWVLENAECETGPGAVATEIEGGFELECISGGEAAFINCTFTNRRDVSPIPTLSEWGMIAAAAGLAMIGVFFALKRRKAKAV